MYALFSIRKTYGNDIPNYNGLLLKGKDTRNDSNQNYNVISSRNCMNGQNYSSHQIVDGSDNIVQVKEVMSSNRNIIIKQELLNGEELHDTLQQEVAFQDALSLYERGEARSLKDVFYVRNMELKEEIFIVKIAFVRLLFIIVALIIFGPGEDVFIKYVVLIIAESFLFQVVFIEWKLFVEEELLLFIIVELCITAVVFIIVRSIFEGVTVKRVLFEFERGKDGLSVVEMFNIDSKNNKCDRNYDVLISRNINEQNHYIKNDMAIVDVILYLVCSVEWQCDRIVGNHCPVLWYSFNLLCITLAVPLIGDTCDDIGRDYTDGNDLTLYSELANCLSIDITQYSEISKVYIHDSSGSSDLGIRFCGEYNYLIVSHDLVFREIFYGIDITNIYIYDRQNCYFASDEYSHSIASYENLQIQTGYIGDTPQACLDERRDHAIGRNWDINKFDDITGSDIDEHKAGISIMNIYDDQLGIGDAKSCNIYDGNIISGCFTMDDGCGAGISGDRIEIASITVDSSVDIDYDYSISIGSVGILSIGSVVLLLVVSLYMDLISMSHYVDLWYSFNILSFILAVQLISDTCVSISPIMGNGKDTKLYVEINKRMNVTRIRNDGLDDDYYMVSVKDALYQQDIAVLRDKMLNDQDIAIKVMHEAKLFTVVIRALTSLNNAIGPLSGRNEADNIVLDTQQVEQECNKCGLKYNTTHVFLLFANIKITINFRFIIWFSIMWIWLADIIFWNKRKIYDIYLRLQYLNWLHLSRYECYILFYAYMYGYYMYVYAQKADHMRVSYKCGDGYKWITQDSNKDVLNFEEVMNIEEGESKLSTNLSSYISKSDGIGLDCSRIEYNYHQNIRHYGPHDIGINEQESSSNEEYQSKLYEEMHVIVMIITLIQNLSLGNKISSILLSIFIVGALFAQTRQSQIKRLCHFKIEAFVIISRIICKILSKFVHSIARAAEDLYIIITLLSWYCTDYLINKDGGTRFYKVTVRIKKNGDICCPESITGGKDNCDEDSCDEDNSYEIFQAIYETVSKLERKEKRDQRINNIKIQSNSIDVGDSNLRSNKNDDSVRIGSIQIDDKLRGSIRMVVLCGNGNADKLDVLIGQEINKIGLLTYGFGNIFMLLVTMVLALVLSYIVSLLILILNALIKQARNVLHLNLALILECTGFIVYVCYSTIDWKSKLIMKTRNIELNLIQGLESWNLYLISSDYTIICFRLCINGTLVDKAGENLKIVKEIDAASKSDGGQKQSHGSEISILNKISTVLLIIQVIAITVSNEDKGVYDYDNIRRCDKVYRDNEIGYLHSFVNIGINGEECECEVVTRIIGNQKTKDGILTFKIICVSDNIEHTTNKRSCISNGIGWYVLLFNLDNVINIEVLMFLYSLFVFITLNGQNYVMYKTSFEYLKYFVVFYSMLSSTVSVIGNVSIRPDMKALDWMKYYTLKMADHYLCELFIVCCIYTSQTIGAICIALLTYTCLWLVVPIIFEVFAPDLNNSSLNWDITINIEGVQLDKGNIKWKNQSNAINVIDSNNKWYINVDCDKVSIHTNYINNINGYNNHWVVEVLKQMEPDMLVFELVEAVFLFWLYYLRLVFILNILATRNDLLLILQDQLQLVGLVQYDVDVSICILNMKLEKCLVSEDGQLIDDSFEGKQMESVHCILIIIETFLFSLYISAISVIFKRTNIPIVGATLLESTSMNSYQMQAGDVKGINSIVNISQNGSTTIYDNSLQFRDIQNRKQDLVFVVVNKV